MLLFGFLVRLRFRYVFSSQVVLLVNPLHVFFLFWCVAASFAVRKRLSAYNTFIVVSPLDN